jgi:prefoldin subunit 5
MTKQAEMFPKTELDEATEILKHLEAEYEKAEKAVTAAQDKAYDALQRLGKQKHVVKLIQSQMPAVDPITGEVEA